MENEFIYREILEQPAIARRIAEGEPYEWPDVTGCTVVTGAGDSLAAAELVRELCPHRRIEAIPVLQASALARTLGPDDCLIGISASGRTPRVVEAAGRARARGATVVAVTDDPGSPLAAEAGRVWSIGASPVAELQDSSYATPEAQQYVGYHHDVAQTKTFLAALLTLARAGGAAGCERAGALVERLCRPEFRVPLHERAQSLAESGQAFFLGHAGNLPLARFATYKLFEFNRIAHHSDFEEYCHTHYFVTRPGDAVVFLVDNDDGARRAGEIEPVLRELFDARTLVLRAGDLPTALERTLFHLLHLEWLTYLWGRIDAPDINRFHAGFDTERLVAASLRTIRRSDVRIP